MRPYKRAKLCIAQTFIDVEAKDSGDDDSDEFETDGDLQSFLVNDEVDSSGRVTHVLETGTACRFKEETETLADRSPLILSRQLSHHHSCADIYSAVLGVQNRRTPPGDWVELGSDVSMTTSMKLFILPTKIGMELHAGTDLESRVEAPCKVLASPRLLGRIYLLAPKKKVVRDYVRGLSYTGINPDIIQQVPLSDMDIILQQIRTQGKVKSQYAPKRWVRFRYGPLKAKLGYVQSVRADDLLRIVVLGSGTFKEEAGSIRFDERPVDGLGTRKRDFWCFQDTDSCPAASTQVSLDPDRPVIISVYGIHIAVPVEPHASEIEDFTMLGFDTVRTTNRSFLQHGDQVRVVAGELRGSLGVIQQVTGDEATVELARTQGDSCLSCISISLSDIERVFEIGRAVIVKIGKHIDRAGYVVASTGYDLVVLERCARNEFVVPQAFVQTCNSKADLTNYKIHERGAVEGSLVHVIGLNVVGRILQITEDGNIELDIPTTKGRNNMIFRPSEVVDIETYQRLDGVQFDGAIEVSFALSRFVDRRSLHGTENVKLRPANAVRSASQPRDHRMPSKTSPVSVPQDNLAVNTIKQDVYVLKSFKRFGRLVAVNGNSHALVILDGELQPQAFPLNDVLSLQTFLCLDNSVSSDIDDLLLHMSLRRTGRIPTREWNHSQPTITQSVKKAPVCYWILESRIQDLLQKHRIFFRFIDSCVSPGNVARMPAWTTVKTSIRSCSKDASEDIGDALEIFVTYKTRDAKEFSSFVLLSNLMNFNPKTVDKALVVKGSNIGQVLPVERMDKGGKDHPGGILLRESGSGRNKKLVRYELSDVTKIQCL